MQVSNSLQLARRRIAKGIWVVGLLGKAWGNASVGCTLLPQLTRMYGGVKAGVNLQGSDMLRLSNERCSPGKRWEEFDTIAAMRHALATGGPWPGACVCCITG